MSTVYLPVSSWLELKRLFIDTSTLGLSVVPFVSDCSFTNFGAKVSLFFIFKRTSRWERGAIVSDVLGYSPVLHIHLT